tara:strand:- start:120 stop:1457 length:1338 start_codon:yes stop_codon:yes gene_type:complete
MKITHYSNSFVSIKENNTLIACDPWIGCGSENGWLSFPIYKNGTQLLNNIEPKYIYISHLHCDHFDRINLKKIRNKNIKIIIKKFKNKRLKFKIARLGFKKIIECDEWKKYKLNKDFSIAIIPQISSNSSDVSDSINFDLDTSIVIQSNITKKIFYNNVDNPLNIKDLIKVRQFIKKEFKNDINLCCLPVGAAGEYPHCFTNINRIKEKKRIISFDLKNLKKQIKALKVKNFFHAGGIYTIFGKFHSLNKLVATPNDKQIQNLIKKLKVNYFNILGGNNLELKKNICKKIISNKFNLPTKKIAIKETKKIKYFYEKNIIKYDERKLDAQFLKSKEKYFEIIKRFKIKSSWQIDFYIYKNLFLNNRPKIDKKKSKYLKKYSLNYNRKNKKFSHLKCFLDLSLFDGMLRKKYIWNPALAGSVVIFERKPNIFDPNLTFSLNFLSCVN